MGSHLGEEQNRFENRSHQKPSRNATFCLFSSCIPFVAKDAFARIIELPLRLCLRLLFLPKNVVTAKRAARMGPV